MCTLTYTNHCTFWVQTLFYYHIISYQQSVKSLTLKLHVFLRKSSTMMSSLCKSTLQVDLSIISRHYYLFTIERICDAPKLVSLWKVTLSSALTVQPPRLCNLGQGSHHDGGNLYWQRC